MILSFSQFHELCDGNRRYTPTKQSATDFGGVVPGIPLERTGNSRRKSPHLKTHISGFATDYWGGGTGRPGGTYRPHWFQRTGLIGCNFWPEFH